MVISSRRDEDVKIAFGSSILKRNQQLADIVSQREVPTVCISDPPLPGLIGILLGTNVHRHLSKVNVTPDQIQQFASSPFPSPLIPPGLCELTLDSQEFGGQHYSGAEEGL